MCLPGPKSRFGVCRSWGWLAVALLLVGPGQPSSAEGRQGTRPGRATPSLEDHETNPERPPPPEPVLEQGAGDEQRTSKDGFRWRLALDALRASVLEWHERLSQGMPPVAAWAVIGAPLWLPLLWFAVRRAGRRPRRPRSAKPSRPARADGTRAAPRAAAPAVVEQPAETQPTVTRLELSPPRRLLDRLGGGLHDTLLGLGLADETVAILTDLVRTQIDRSAWLAAVSGGEDEELQALRRQWLKRVALARVERWLATHTAVVDSGLSVQVPGVLEADEVANLDLTQPDGLGATLSSEEEELLDRARRALAAVFANADNPNELHAVAAEQGLEALLPAIEGESPLNVHASYALALLLRGMAAIDSRQRTGWQSPDLEELRAALAEHRAVSDAPVPAEGSAVHALAALDGGMLPGVGALMACVAGAAYSVSSVVLLVSKNAGEMEKLAAATLTRFGRHLLRALEEPEAGDGEVLLGNAAKLLGIDLLARYERSVGAALRQFERMGLRRPLWAEAKSDDPERPDAALLGLHQQRVRWALQQARLAQGRLLQIFRGLSYAGKTGENEAIACRRLGYAVVMLGMPLLRGASTEMLSAAREALAAVEPDIEYVSVE